jgi:hypothetical protein
MFSLSLSLSLSMFAGILGWGLDAGLTNLVRVGGGRPILTPKTVLPLFFIVGIVFAPIGGLLLYASSQVCGFFFHFFIASCDRHFLTMGRCKN